MAGMGEDVYCTLLMSNSYLPGALVLAHSLRDTQTSKKLAVLVTLDTVSPDSVKELENVYDYIIPVDKIRNPNPENLFLMNRGDLAFAFTKITVWRLLQFRKVVYLDADVVALRAPDELFDIEASFAAAPDVGWPDAFNTGVMVVSPNMGDYWALQNLAESGKSFDGADQGLLNQYYQDREWRRISFTYNCTPNAQYQWEPAFRHYRNNISMVHFIGRQKPWSSSSATQQGTSTYNELLSTWWAVHDRHIQSRQSTPGRAEADKVKDFLSVSKVSSSDRAPYEPVVTSQYYSDNEAPPSIIDIDDGTDSMSSHKMVERNPLNEMPPEKKIIPNQHNAQWDATKSAPPQRSKAEAIDLSFQTYHFSREKELFRAPPSYPVPPKDMYYRVPEMKPKTHEKPKPIFPWEERALPPTRIFVEDLIPETEVDPDPEQKESIVPDASLPMTVLAQATDNSDEIAEESDENPPQNDVRHNFMPLEEPWQEFIRTSNVWDSVPGINTYVRAVKDLQERHKNAAASNIGNISALQIETEMEKDAQKNESLVLTDFPTEIERPSLPVTPAPIQRPVFWGDDREATIALPPAEGVPTQADWTRFTNVVSKFSLLTCHMLDAAVGLMKNPSEKLEELSGNSVLDSEHVKMPIPYRATSPPLRELPERLANLTSVSSI